MRHFVLISILIMFVCTAHSEEESKSFSLIKDPDFSQGFKILAPKQGQKVVLGTIGGTTPQWETAQWASHYSLHQPKERKTVKGGFWAFDGAKTFGLNEGVLQMGVDAGKEFLDGPRKKGQAWPHLLVEQGFADIAPRLDEMASVQFSVEARLLQDKRPKPEGYTPSLHAAQFLIYFVVQNRNKASKGFGDFLWLGVPIYDDRREVTGHVIEGDVGHNKIIYMPGRDVYTAESTEMGKWIRFEADMLVLAKKALEESWRREFLTDSKDFHDYAIKAMNMGWEVPGMNDVLMEVRGLTVEALEAGEAPAG
mgnify:CR=1 FL=1